MGGLVSNRGSIVGWTVAIVTLTALALFGAEGDARWPWLMFNCPADSVVPPL